MDSALSVVVAVLMGLAVGRFLVMTWVNRERVWSVIAFLAFAGPITLQGSLPTVTLGAFFVASMGTIVVSVSMPERRDSSTGVAEIKSELGE